MCASDRLSNRNQSRTIFHINYVTAEGHYSCGMKDVGLSRNPLFGSSTLCIYLYRQLHILAHIHLFLGSNKYLKQTGNTKTIMRTSPTMLSSWQIIVMANQIWPIY